MIIALASEKKAGEIFNFLPNTTLGPRDFCAVTVGDVSKEMLLRRW